MNITKTPALDYGAIARSYFLQAHQIMSDKSLANEYGTNYVRTLTAIGELALRLEERVD